MLVQVFMTLGGPKNTNITTHPFYTDSVDQTNNTNLAEYRAMLEVVAAKARVLVVCGPTPAVR